MPMLLGACVDAAGGPTSNALLTSSRLSSDSRKFSSTRRRPSMQVGAPRRAKKKGRVRNVRVFRPSFHFCAPPLLVGGGKQGLPAALKGPPPPLPSPIPSPIHFTGKMAEARFIGVTDGCQRRRGKAGDLSPPPLQTSIVHDLPPPLSLSLSLSLSSCEGRSLSSSFFQL